MKSSLIQVFMSDKKQTKNNRVWYTAVTEKERKNKTVCVCTTIIHFSKY